MNSAHPIRAPRTFGTCLATALLVFGLAGACSGNNPDPDPDPTDSGTEVVDAGADAGGTTGDAGGETGACSPTAQTGCSEPTPKCGIVSNKFGCQAAGTVEQDGACVASAAGDDCATGLFCMNNRCRRFCDTSAGASACPMGQSCSQQVVWNGGGANGEVFNACVTSGSECDPLAQDCAVASEACFATSAGNKCYVPGTVEDGSPCNFANDCKKGSTCIDVGGSLACRAFCTPPAASDAGSDPDAGEEDAGTSPAPITCTTGTCMDTGSGYGICR